VAESNQPKPKDLFFLSVIFLILSAVSCLGATSLEHGFAIWLGIFSAVTALATIFIFILAITWWFY
jgi:hypothetical protein